MERTASKFAVIDIGSNSVRFALERAGRLPEKRVFTTRLGRGLNETGRLGEDAMRMSIEVVSRCAGEARSLGFTPVAYATSAVRDAANGAEFARAITEMTGVPVEVIPGETEARYAFLGAVGEGSFDTLIDLGGASMQVVTRESAVSFRAGCVRCTDTVLGVRSGGGIDLERRDPAHEWDVHPYAKVRALRKYLDGAVGDLPRVGEGGLAGVGGTITTLAAYSLGLTKYDPEKVHGAVLTRSWLGPAFYRLCAMGDEGRRADPILSSRHDTLLTGLVILQYAMERLFAERLTVSTRDGMEGYLGHVKGCR